MGNESIKKTIKNNYDFGNKAQTYKHKDKISSSKTDLVPYDFSVQYLYIWY